LLVACLLLTGPLCSASSLEANCLAARDRFIARIAALDKVKQHDESAKQQKLAKVELTKMLQPIIGFGPVAIKGFAARAYRELAGGRQEKADKGLWQDLEGFPEGNRGAGGR
jgi:hypothetical protein